MSPFQLIELAMHAQKPFASCLWWEADCFFSRLRLGKGGVRRSDTGRQSKQLRWADTARQLDQQLLRDSQQPATSIPSAASSGNIAPNTADTGSAQISGQNCCGAAITHQHQSMHLEELYALA